jgi:hypothetical protein
LSKLSARRCRPRSKAAIAVVGNKVAEHQRATAVAATRQDRGLAEAEAEVVVGDAVVVDLRQ